MFGIKIKIIIYLILFLIISSLFTVIAFQRVKIVKNDSTVLEIKDKYKKELDKKNNNFEKLKEDYEKVTNYTNAILKESREKDKTIKQLEFKVNRLERVIKRKGLDE